MKNKDLISQATFASIVKVSPQDISKAKKNGAFSNDCFVYHKGRVQLDKKRALECWIVHSGTHGNSNPESKNAALIELKRMSSTLNIDDDYDINAAVSEKWIETITETFGGGSDLDNAKLEEIETRIIWNKIRIAKEKGQLIERQTIASILSAMHGNIRNRLQSLPSRVASQVRSFLTDHEAEIFLAKEIEELCNDISKIEFTIDEEVKNIDNL